MKNTKSILHTQSDIFPDQVQRQVYQLAKLYQYCDRVCLTDLGVGATQGYALLSLPPVGSMTMNDLSSALGLANSTTTRIVDQLVRKGLTRRKADSGDRRIVQVELTARGQEMQRTLDKTLQDFFRQALREIPEDEHSMILNSLERVTQSITKALG